MSDKDKSKAQLISELCELRRQLKSQQAMVSSDSGDSAKEHDELTSDLRQSRKELSDSPAETKNSNKALAESRKTSRTSEQNLADVHERYDILGDLIPFGIWTADARGAITFLSDVFLEMTGIPLKETARFDWLDQLTHQTVLKAISDWSGSLYERDIWEGEFTVTSQEGRQYDILIRGVPLLDKEGDILSWLGINLDISKRKRAEQEREKLQSELFQARKMESVGILAGCIAHDFNNLLHAMGGNIELLLKGKPDDHADVRRLKAIEKSMNRSAQLIRQLLTFSRKTVPSKQHLDLDHEIVSAAQVLERTIPKMVKIELYPGKDIRSVNADPVQIEQILLNLGVNAADAMPEGGRLIIETKNIIMDQDFVRTHQGARPGEYVLMTVTDTGCGMDRKTLEHVFDPFFTTKEVGKGTGLGLASVYGIVKVHEGYVTCYSEVGQGTTFKIYLPAAEPGMAAPDKKESMEEVSIGGPETILIVDDDDEIRDLARELLEDSGYQVLSAASGEQALEIFKEHTREIDLVVMDLNMPGMGGRKCTTEMLSIDPSVKVLVASGYSAVGHGREALEFGAKDFISKPYQMRDILAKIREVLDGE
jgi:PAS domain S-box-containing protein